MTGDPVFRVITLAVGMLIIGLGRYTLRNRQLLARSEDPSKASREAKRKAIEAAVIFAVLYMVFLLGYSAYN